MGGRYASLTAIAAVAAAIDYYAEPLAPISFEFPILMLVAACR
ncbi:hypothetical protein OROGR_028351 [Orobanche gracilis]